MKMWRRIAVIAVLTLVVSLMEAAPALADDWTGIQWDMSVDVEERAQFDLRQSELPNLDGVKGHVFLSGHSGPSGYYETELVYTDYEPYVEMAFFKDSMDADDWGVLLVVWDGLDDPSPTIEYCDVPDDPGQIFFSIYLDLDGDVVFDVYEYGNMMWTCAQQTIEYGAPGGHDLEWVTGSNEYFVRTHDPDDPAPVSTASYYYSYILYWDDTVLMTTDIEDECVDEDGVISLEGDKFFGGDSSSTLGCLSTSSYFNSQNCVVSMAVGPGPLDFCPGGTGSTGPSAIWGIPIWDLDGDCDCDDDDLDIAVDAWNTDYGEDEEYRWQLDYDHDGHIGLSDIMKVQYHWGTDCTDDWEEGYWDENDYDYYQE